MSGSWRISDKPLKEKHNHIMIETEGFCLNYVDPRRFGKSYFLNETNKNDWFKRLGVDVSSPAFNLLYLKELQNKGSIQ